MGGRPDMAKIVKLIWRLDYPVSYSYIDARGRALKVIRETVDGFWKSVGDGALHMSFIARHAMEDSLRMLSLETNCLNGAFEWQCGTELSSVLRSEQFRGVDRIARELLKIAEVRRVGRAGVRFFCVENYADGRANAHDRTLGLLNDRLRANATSSLGTITDVGVVFEGAAEDKVSYRSSHGPYARKNLELILETPPTQDQYTILGDPDLFFDIDLYEQDFSFEEHSLFRWTETKLEKAIQFIKSCTGAAK
jgi:hypothetical protein